jgi:hypothetical protein
VRKATAVSSRGLGRSPLKAQTRVRIPLPLLGMTMRNYGRPHRLSVRTAPFHGAERGSIPLGAMGEQRKHDELLGAVAQLVRVPVCHTGGRGFEPRQPRSMQLYRECGRKCSCNPEGRTGPGGEIGRHAILRGWCRKASRFESAPGHTDDRSVARDDRQRSSVVEHSIRNRAVVGSIPTAGSE